MNAREYIDAILESQTMSKGSPELEELERHERDITALIAEKLKETTADVRVGGSRAKKTMIKEAYDLDLHVRFARDDESAGKTLEEIYNRIRDILAEQYNVTTKTSAIRVLGASDQKPDLHIDVVPARFVDDESSDAFLHQKEGKDRLKTNLDMHINHVRDSGVTEIVKLAKLWTRRRHLSVKTFVLELLVIDAVAGSEMAGKTKPEKFEAFLKHLSSKWETLAVKDPANPTGNDLSSLLSFGIKWALRENADRDLLSIKEANWSAIFGEAPQPTSPKIAAVQATAQHVIKNTGGTKPWAHD